MANKNCKRCKGTGSYEMSEDAHRSSGIVPCCCPNAEPERPKYKTNESTKIDDSDQYLMYF